MGKTIYLHIGHFKTGTTALQAFLSANDKPLARRGLDYLRAGRHLQKHSGLAFALYRAAGVRTLMHGYAQNRKPVDMWGALFDAARASPSAAVLVSSEELMRLGAHPKAAAILGDIIAPVRDEFRFRIIAYLRAPQAHLQSWYNQLVKMNVMPVPDFNTAVCQTMEPVHYDYAQALQPWIDIFGPEAVILRPYTPGLRQGDGLFTDFLSIFDIPISPRFTRPKGDLNPRLDDATLDITRLLQMAGYSGQELSWAQTQVERIMAARRVDRDQPFAAITARAAKGLKGLAPLPGNTIDTTQFETDLPHPQDLDLALMTDLLVHILGDMQLLRRNLHSRQADLASRIAALEAKSGGTEPQSDKPAGPGSWILKS